MTTIDLALLVLRVVLGLTFILHGGQKLFGWFGGQGIKGTTGLMNHLGVAHPGLLGWLAALSEFGGGALVLIGLFTPLSAALIASTMVVAIATVHGKNGFFSTNHGYEYNLSLLALSVALMLTGAGSISVDKLLGIAYQLDQLPAWAIVVLVLVTFGGILTTEFSKWVKTIQDRSAGHGQSA